MEFSGRTSKADGATCENREEGACVTCGRNSKELRLCDAEGAEENERQTDTESMSEGTQAQ